MKRNFTFLQNLCLNAFFLLSLSSGYGQDYGFEWVMPPQYEFSDFYNGWDGSGCSYEIPIVFANGLALCYKDRFTMAVFNNKGERVTEWYENVISEQWTYFNKKKIRLFKLSNPIKLKKDLAREEKNHGLSILELSISEEILTYCNSKIDIFLQGNEVIIKETPLTIQDIYDYAYDAIYTEGLATFYQDGNVGYMDKQLNIVIPPLFDSGSNFYKGIAKVKRDNKIAFINRTGRIISEEAFDEVSNFNQNDIALAKIDTQLVFINRSGIIMSEYFNCGNCSIQANKPSYDNKVIINKMLNKKKFENVLSLDGFLSDSWFRYVRGASSELYIVSFNYKTETYMSTEGVLWNKTFRRAYSFNNGLAKVEIGYNIYSFVDEHGQVWDEKFSDIKEFSDGLAAVRPLDSKKWTLVDKNQNIKFLPQYDKLYNRGNGHWSAKKGDKWGLINTSGELIYPFDIKSKHPPFRYLGNDNFLIRNNKKEGIYNISTKKFNVPLKYFEVGIIDTLQNIFYATIVDNTKTGWEKYRDSHAIYRNGKRISIFFEVIGSPNNSSENKTRNYSSTDFNYTPLAYDAIGFGVVSKNNKIGFINKQGELIVPCVFDKVSNIVNNLAWASQNGKWGIIRIIPPKLSPDINIEWKTPNLPFDTLTTYNNSQDLSLSIQSEVPLTWQDVQLFVNGNSMDAGKAGEQLKPEGKNGKYYRYSYHTIFVFDSVGTYDIQIKLLNKDFIYSGPIQAISYQIKTKALPKLYLISIGTEPEDLKFTGNDARDFIGLFDNQKAIYSRIYKKLLVGKDATAANIKKAINDFANHALLQPNDVIMIFVSSHAYPNGDELYIQANDFNPSSDSMKLETSVSLREDIKNPLKNIPCKKVLFIDACHSGGYGKGGKATVGSAAAAKMQETALNATGLTYLTSSGAEKSYEYDLYSNGIFTEALVEGLQKGRADVSPNKNESKDDLITITELFNYIAAKVPQLSKTANQPKQEPKMKNQLGDLIIFAVEQ